MDLEKPKRTVRMHLVCANRGGRILEAASSLPSYHNLEMAIAELDLSIWSASRIDLAEHYRRVSPSAPRHPAGTRIAAVSDLNGCPLWIEVSLEQSF
jgi:hypothetical protein